MQDRFKFRLYDKKEKEMRYEVYATDYDLSQTNNYRFVLMQSTGLKDRNGKLIYEGDILKYTDCEGKETIGSLEVDRFNLLTFTNMVNCDFCEDWADVAKAVFFTGNSTIEVIGNIYQDSHLLEN